MGNRRSISTLANLDQVISQFLKKNFGWSSTLVRAKVPIIKCCIPSKNIPEVPFFKMDISCYNDLGLYNSILLRAYLEQHELVCPLVRLIKDWTSKREVKGAPNYFSSYSLTILAIFYLLWNNPLDSAQQHWRIKKRTHISLAKGLLKPITTIERLFALPLQKTLVSDEGGYIAIFPCSESETEMTKYLSGEFNFIEKADLFKPLQISYRLNSDSVRKNSNDLMSLFEGFLRFYAFEFDEDEDVVDIAAYLHDCAPNQTASDGVEEEVLTAAVRAWIGKEKGLCQKRINFIENCFLPLYDSRSNFHFISKLIDRKKQTSLKDKKDIIFIRDPLIRSKFLHIRKSTHRSEFKMEIIRAWFLLRVGTKKAFDEIFAEKVKLGIENSQGENVSFACIHQFPLFKEGVFENFFNIEMDQQNEILFDPNCNEVIFKYMLHLIRQKKLSEFGGMSEEQQKQLYKLSGNLKIHNLDFPVRLPLKLFFSAPSPKESAWQEAVAPPDTNSHSRLQITTEDAQYGWDDNPWEQRKENQDLKSHSGENFVSLLSKDTDVLHASASASELDTSLPCIDFDALKSCLVSPPMLLSTCSVCEGISQSEAEGEVANFEEEDDEENHEDTNKKTNLSRIDAETKDFNRKIAQIIMKNSEEVLSKPGANVNNISSVLNEYMKSYSG
eukprot:GDKJ01043874.1.p1 GENE.GDKJ01043874.1~~GDKJ01043874.1.p1  ORF type:complete len:776 (+),score=158.47 GDKJ01043874.1:322-2328(+)